MDRRRTALFLGLALAALQTPAAAEHSNAAERPFGLTRRVPWSTSNFRGRPEPPPPFRSEIVYPNLRFDKTTVLAVEPATNRMFVGERAGKIYALPEDRNAAKADLFLDAALLVERLNAPGKPPLEFDSLYGLTFDPDFATNRFCYVCYVVRPRDRDAPQLPDGTRVVRFRVADTDPPRCEVDTEQLVIAWLQGGHNGGCLKFGPDGCLYVSSGDGGTAFPPDGLNSGQDLSTLLAKVLRIDVRRGEGERLYSIPPDNPFVGVAGARGETWAYGLRNPWKMSFDRKTGALWVGDVGWELWELVYRVEKGDNFGWSIVEGSQPVHSERRRGPTPIVPPTMEIPHTEGASITGGFVYRGRKFPELDGTYVFGDWETRRMWGAKLLADGKLGERYEIVDPVIRIVDFAEDRDGELYLLDHEDGAIYTFARNVVTAAANPFPRKLSETGLLESVAEHRPAPGVLPFSINAEQWSDGATAERLAAVPGVESIRLHARPQLIPGSQFSRAVDYPRDTVLVKTLSLDMKQGDPTSRRRIETQTLHYDGREWQAYTYQWNDSQTDAELVERGGKSQTFEIADPSSPGGKRTQTWRFASRNECLRCHNPWSEYALAFNLAQLNREHDYGGAIDNQIRTLRHIGLLEDVVDRPDPSDPAAVERLPQQEDLLPRLTPPFDPAGDLDRRARAYLHVNCGHCHRFNGGGSSYVYLQHDTSLAEMRAVGVRPSQGTFGIHEAEVLAPGDPYRSVLYFRLAKTGPGHMPHLGAKMIDERGLALIHDWIRQLPTRLDDTAKLDRLIALDEPAALRREQDEAPQRTRQLARRAARQHGREEPAADDWAAARRELAEQHAAAVPARAAERRTLAAELLASPSRALLTADALRQQRLPGPIRSLVMDTALGEGIDPAVRDLFEPFLPEDQRTARLGDSVNPADILKLTGDAERGRRLFHESSVVQCRNCHRIADRGVQLGPDLDGIGKKNDRAKLLESILQPSLRIEPKFAMWLVETRSGAVVSGLLIERNEKTVIVKDARNTTHRIAVDDIEGMFQQTKSFMPELLVRDFTPQQAADLLAYLASLKAEREP